MPPPSSQQCSLSKAGWRSQRFGLQPGDVQGVARDDGDDPTVKIRRQKVTVSGLFDARHRMRNEMRIIDDNYNYGIAKET